MKEWFDRNELKIKLDEWLKSDSCNFLLTLDDSLEFEDITEWFLARERENLKVCVSYHRTDSEVTCFALLDDIVSELDRGRFTKFAEMYAKKSKAYEEMSATDRQFIINQSMGTEIESESFVDFAGNSQTINVIKPDPQTARMSFFESQISDFLWSFSIDLDNIDKGVKKLIVCRFNGSGFDRLNGRFKAWLQDKFIKKISKPHVKMIIMCQNNAGNLVDSFDSKYQFKLNDLRLPDIIPIAVRHFNHPVKGEYFCRGIIRQKDNAIDYKGFANKLRNENPV